MTFRVGDRPQRRRRLAEFTCRVVGHTAPRPMRSIQFRKGTTWQPVNGAPLICDRCHEVVVA